MEDSLRPAFLAHPEGLFRLAVDSLPTGVIVVAADGAIVFANPEVERQFGYPRDEILAQSIETLLPGVLQAIHVARDETSESSDAPPNAANQRCTGRRRDGTGTACLHLTPSCAGRARAPRCRPPRTPSAGCGHNQP